MAKKERIKNKTSNYETQAKKKKEQQQQKKPDTHTYKKN